MKHFFYAFLLVLLVAGLASAQVAKQGGSHRPLAPNGFPIYNNVPDQIAYQGLLTTTAGVPVTNGSYSIKFELFNVPTSGSVFWSETQPTVTVTNGTFSVYLGSVNALPPIFYQPLYLQVTAVSGPGISGSTTFPRTAFSSSPYALALHLPYWAAYSLPASNDVLFIGNTGGGVGIEGAHDSTAGTDPGVLGTTYSLDAEAIAVEGISVQTSPGSSSTGVKGVSNGTGYLGIGVWGEQEGSGWGVYGYTPYGDGVYAQSVSGVGVYSNSISGDAVDGYSTSGVGVYGYSQSNYGVQAYSDSSTGVYTESRLGLGVYGLSDSSIGVIGLTGNSSGYGVLSWGPLGVFGSGDNSVQLPDNAIDSYEILDEPGIAAKAHSGFVFITSVGPIFKIDSVTITVPAPGKITVQATGYAIYDHTNATDDNYGFNIDSDPGGAIYQPGVSSFVIPAGLPSFTNGRQSFSCLREFDAPTAGSYTFYLLASQFTGNNVSSYVGNPFIHATYFPTVYGSVPNEISPSASTGNGDATPGYTAATVSYQTSDQFNSAKKAQMNLQVNQLSQRVAQLESMIQQMKTTSVAKKQKNAVTSTLRQKNSPHQ